MYVDCDSCGITHHTVVEAQAMHDATMRVHRAWKRRLLALFEPPPVVEVKVKPKPQAWETPKK
jgi:hypothetical protein